VAWYDLLAGSFVVAYEGDWGNEEEALRLWETLELKEMGIPRCDIRDVRLLQ